LIAPRASYKLRHRDYTFTLHATGIAIKRKKDFFVTILICIDLRSDGL